MRFTVEPGLLPATNDVMRPLEAVPFLTGETDRWVEDAEGVRTVWTRGSAR